MANGNVSEYNKASKPTIKVKEKQFVNADFIPEIIKLLNEGHTVTLQLRGYSMRPFLEDGRDKALLIKSKNPHLGAPVLAEVSPGHYVLHRIISMKGEDVVLRGDGNIGVERCKLSDIKGEAIGFYRKGRKSIDKTNGLKWCTYSFFWTILFPIRRYLLAVHRRLIHLL